MSGAWGDPHQMAAMAEALGGNAEQLAALSAMLGTKMFNVKVRTNQELSKVLDWQKTINKELENEATERKDGELQHTKKCTYW